MQITLNQDEIINALEAYVRSQISISENQRIVIDLKAGRGDNGYSATLDILPAESKPQREYKPTPMMSKPVEPPVKIFAEPKPAAAADTDGEDPVIEDAEEEVVEIKSEAAVSPRSIFAKAN